MRYTKTDAGKQAIIDRSTSLSSRQRSALIIVNGERSLEVLLKMVEGLGITLADIQHMESQGLIAKIQEDEPVVVTNTSSAKNTAIDSNVQIGEAQLRYSKAYPLATQITAKMGLRGFRLNLAVEAAGSYSQLIELFPKTKEAVGAEKAMDLEKALRGEI
jgi:hypothetical protein